MSVGRRDSETGSRGGAGSSSAEALAREDSHDGNDEDDVAFDVDEEDLGAEVDDGLDESDSSALKRSRNFCISGSTDSLGADCECDGVDDAGGLEDVAGWSCPGLGDEAAQSQPILLICDLFSDFDWNSFLQ